MADRGQVDEENTMNETQERTFVTIGEALGRLIERAINEVVDEYDAEVDFEALEQVAGEFVCAGMGGR